MTWAIFPNDQHVRALREVMSNPSDRIIAVVGGAFLEVAVTRTLEERLCNLPDVLKKLFGSERALEGIAPKIDLLCLLGAFDEPTSIAMKAIPRVRNVFAHDLDASFDSPSSRLDRAMDRLTLHNHRTHYPHHLYGPDSKHVIEPTDSNRDRFIVNLKLALLILMRDRCSHETYTNQPFTQEQLREKFQQRRDAEERRESQAGDAAQRLTIETTATPT
jgi:hypothetical protein